MRKVNLRMNEQQKYDVIKMFIDGKVTKAYCDIKLEVSRRTINRLIKRYREGGKAAFIHGNRGKKPARTIKESIEKDILLLYQNKYENSNLAHFTELLEEQEDIKVSESYIRKLFQKNTILAPKCWKRTRRAELKRLRDLANSPATDKKVQAAAIQRIVDLEDAHPRRERSANLGELIQMDASLHLWFGDKKSTLHAAIDDATGKLVGMTFDLQETLHGYYEVTRQILTNHGIPVSFFTDRRTVFEYKKVSSPKIEKDTFTQFSYACKILGIEIKTSSVPQAKGRIERLFQTLQSRLPIELQLHNITTIEAANEFLVSYIEKFNEKFSLPIHHSKNVFVQQPEPEKINQILAVIAPRVIDAGHCVKYNKEFYLPVNGNGMTTYFAKGTKALVIEAFDKTLYLTVDKIVYALQKVAIRAEASNSLEAIEKPAPRKYYIPPMSHPWKEASFQRYLMKQNKEKEYQEAINM